MDRKAFILSCVTVLLAAATSSALHENGLDHLKYRFRTGAAVRKDLERTIEKFNQLYASFYVTGGSTFGLSDFPGTNLVKRRIYQDIDLWQKKRQWLIHDLHGLELARVEMPSPEFAVVETRETWDMWLRSIDTGVKTGRKTNAIKVRYYLGRNRGRWIVGEYEVYDMNEDIPPVSESLL